MNFFKNDLSFLTFFKEISSKSYAVTQEGFDSLANAINERIDSSF